MLMGTHRHYFNAHIRLRRITVLADPYGTTNLIVPFLDRGYFSWKKVLYICDLPSGNKIRVVNLTRTHLAKMCDPSITQQIFAERLLNATHRASDRKFKDEELGTTAFCRWNGNQGQNQRTEFLPLPRWASHSWGLKWQWLRVLWGIYPNKSFRIFWAL